MTLTPCTRHKLVWRRTKWWIAYHKTYWYIAYRVRLFPTATFSRVLR